MSDAEVVLVVVLLPPPPSACAAVACAIGCTTGNGSGSGSGVSGDLCCSTVGCTFSDTGSACDCGSGRTSKVPKSMGC